MNLKISQKIPLLVVMAAVICGSVVGITSYLASKELVIRTVENQHSSLLVARKIALDNYLNSIKEDLITVSTNSAIIKAIKDFSSSWEELESNQTQTLQKLYIKNNPNPTGSKEELDYADDNSLYSKAHGSYHPWFRSYLRIKGYYDIFLFDMKGNLIYTVFKELDYATNMNTGQWKGTNLAMAFRKAAEGENISPHYFDFEPYEPSHGEPASFISMPVVENGKKIGVVAFQMPIKRINKTMAVYEGLGETGETYIVGEDYLMRSDSRFSQKSTILKTRVDGPTVKKGLNGNTGIEIVNDYRGIRVFSAYSPFEFMGTKWVLLGEQDESEVLSGLIDSRNKSLIRGIVVFFVFAGIGLYMTRKITSPINEMVALMKLSRKGDMAFEVPYADRNDEIGEMASALELFRKTANDMQQKERRIRLITDNIPAYISYIDEDSVYRFMNASFGLYLNKPISELINKHVKDVIGEGAYKQLRQNLDRGLSGEAMRFEENLYVDGRYIYVDVVFVPDIDDKGKVLGVYSIANDITDMKEAEDGLKDAKEEAEQANKMKSLFLARMSHELRTPMGGVVGLLELLLNSELNEKQEKWAKTSYKCGEELIAMVNDILDLSKIESGELKLESENFNLDDIVKDVVEVLMPLAEKNSVELSFNTNLGDTGNISGDRHRIRQILFNLIGNSIKFSKDETVTVRTHIVKEKKKENICIEVVDTGVGIPKDKHEAIFADYSQADDSVARKYGGTGLGLNISKQLVEMMGGKIGVESEEGKGSTFWFTLVSYNEHYESEDTDSKAVS